MRNALAAITAFAVCTLAINGATAQTTAVQPAYGPFQIGMTEDQVRAVAPHVEWQRMALGPEALLIGRSGYDIGGLTFAPMVRISYDATVSHISFRAQQPVSTTGECRELLTRVVTRGLEPGLGPFDGGARPGEHGVPFDSTETSRGSRLRFYVLLDGERVVGFANKRGAGFAEASAVTEPAREGYPLGSMNCSLDVQFDRRPVPVLPILTPPSAEELAAAELIAEPEWLEGVASRDLELNLPDLPPGRKTSGHALLDCLVMDDGRLNCVLVEEEPQAMYGQTAMGLSRAYRLAESASGRRVQVPMRFEVSGNQTRPILPGPNPFTARDPSAPPAAPLPPSPPAPTAEIAAARLITAPQWLERPSGDTFARTYPTRALDEGVSGRAVLDCVVDESRRLRCAVAEEEPAGYGFGGAGRQIAVSFRIADEMDGQSTAGGRVRITLTFRAD